MLPQSKKVSRKEFPKSHKKGEIYHSPHLSLVVVKKDSKLPSKFSFVISGKVAKKAVERNKLKRWTYRTIQKECDNIKNGFVSVFFSKKNSTKLTHSQLEDQVLVLLKNAHLLKKNDASPTQLFKE